MDRTEKITRIRELKELIQKKQLLIKEETKKLEILYEQEKKENQSELPILLFLIDETLPMPDPDLEMDYRFEYIYYFPDLDDVVYIIRHKKNEFLTNTIDLRSNFEKVGIPEKIFPGSVRGNSQYRVIIENIVSDLKTKIDELFRSNNINSWNELGLYLTSKVNQEEQTKILKLKSRK